MSNELKIISIYQKLGPMLGIYESATGSLENVSGKPILVSGLNVRYPYKDNLRATIMEAENFCIFHPANENVLMLHSLMIKMIKSNLNKYYNELLIALILNYMELLANKEEQDKLSAADVSKLEGFPIVTAADKKRIKGLLKVAGCPKIINVALHDDVRKKGDVRVYRRATKVNFPLYKAVIAACTSDKPMIAKTAVTVKFAKSFRLILEKLMPYIIDPAEVYGYGGSVGAPSLRSMVEAVTYVASSYNERCELIGSPKVDISANDDQDYSDVKKFMVHALALPTQAWNEGCTVKGEALIIQTRDVPATEINANTTPPWDTTTVTIPAGRIAGMSSPIEVEARVDPVNVAVQSEPAPIAEPMPVQQAGVQQQAVAPVQAQAITDPQLQQQQQQPQMQQQQQPQQQGPDYNLPQQQGPNYNLPQQQPQMQQQQAPIPQNRLVAPQTYQQAPFGGQPQQLVQQQGGLQQAPSTKKNGRGGGAEMLSAAAMEVVTGRGGGGHPLQPQGYPAQMGQHQGNMYPSPLAPVNYAQPMYQPYNS